MGRKRRWHKPLHPSPVDVGMDEFSPSVVAEVESLFRKSFIYKKPSHLPSSKYVQEGETQSPWVLPPVDNYFCDPPWQQPALEQFKLKLNKVKGQLSEFDISTWHSHTQFTNRAGAVIQHLKHHKKPELCTQAWCKFYEIIASYPHIISNMGMGFNSVHLCEAPGAFIASLNHYMVSSGYRGPWQWLAMTLNPYYEGNNLKEMIDDDRFIFHTYDNWYFGTDNTGDIMAKHNLEGLLAVVTDMGPIYLVTADGSIDCQNEPEEQEALTAPLHYSEVITALHILTPGGSLVLKMFTLYEASSIGIMYLLNCVFNQVDVLKPATSKSGNSEVYVVCVDYQGMDSAHLETLTLHIGHGKQDSVLLGLRHLPDDFLTQHIACCEMFTRLQVQTVEENIALFTDMTSDQQQRLEAVRNCCAASYVTRFGVWTLHRSHHIVPQYCNIGKLPRQEVRVPWHQRKRHEGSYVERQQKKQMSWQERIQHMQKLEISEAETKSNWLPGFWNTLDEEIETWVPVKGQKLTRVQSSRFCSPYLLKLYTELKIHTVEQVNQSSFVGPSLIKTVVDLITESFGGKQDGMSLCVVIPDRSYQNKPLLQALQNSVHQNQLNVKYLSDLPMSDHASSDDLMMMLFEGDSREELQSWSHFCSSVHEMFKNLIIGGQMVCSLFGSLTRYTAGILYILHRTFQKICLVSGADSGCQFVVCVGYLGCIPSLVSFIASLAADSEEMNSQQRHVLQPVPIHCLYDSPFLTYLSEANDLYLKYQINRMIDTQKQLLILPSQPHGLLTPNTKSIEMPEPNSLVIKK